MTPPTDILVLGATGFTGRLVTKQLNAHRDRSSFTFALAARSRTKLAALASELDLSATIPLVTVDVTNIQQLEQAVKNAKVVVNTVGPYWKWGTPVVAACVRNGVHYVDITGEIAWVADIITEFDYAATKTHSVIVPCCGMESVPSDIAVHLSVRTLKQFLGPDTEATNSVSALSFRSSGVSGGTLSSVYTYVTQVPRRKAYASFGDHVLSPIAGAPSPPHKLEHTLPHVRPRISGAAVTNPVDRAVILRTRGLLEFHPSMRDAAYGPKFNYKEFVAMRNLFYSVCISLGMLSLVVLLFTSRIFRWVFKHYVVDPNQGRGPSDEAMEKGFLNMVNVTSSAPNRNASEKHAKTMIRIKGDPIYLCTTVMLAECAIALLDTSKLPVFAREGGVLTPATAFGYELVKRLRETKRFTFETSILPWS